MDPYKILEVPKNFTMQQLKDNYKRIALNVHPDKGGSEQLFLLVTKCYKKLKEEYDRRMGNKDFHELKADYKKSQSQLRRPASSKYGHETDAGTSMGTKFDLDKFNKIFSEHKLNDAYDKGYQDWMTEETVPQQQSVNMGKSFNLNNFNKNFETAQVDTRNKFIVKYREPEALVTTKKIGYTELGSENVDDFSGDNMSKKSLNFMDYKVAHSTSRIVDPTIANKVKTYRNVEELERARGGISYHMDQETQEEWEYMQEMEKLKEKKRMAAMVERDRAIREQYEKVNMMMLGRRPV
jgi:curved DNA-binding protein CbpA